MVPIKMLISNTLNRAFCMSSSLLRKKLPACPSLLFLIAATAAVPRAVQSSKA
jgi:hypothetical protein